MATSTDTARLLEVLARAAFPIGAPRAMHPGQWAVLRYLAEAAFPDRTISHVALHLGVTHAPASRAVSALAVKGLVLIVRDEEDHRLKHVELSAKGKALLKADPINRLSAAIEDLGSARQERLGDVLSLLHAQLSRNNK